MAFVVLAGVVGAVVFGMAGGLGRLLADRWFGELERYDDGPLPVRVPMWAFIAVPACAGIGIGLQAPPPWLVAMLLVAVLCLTICAATDLRSGLIPDLVTIAPLVLVLAVSTVRREWSAPVGALFAFAPFAVLAAVSRGRGMGWGDVKLAALGGALVGMGGITLAVAIAAIAASLVAAAGGRGRQPIAFGSYLAASIGAALGLTHAF